MNDLKLCSPAAAHSGSRFVARRCIALTVKLPSAGVLAVALCFAAVSTVVAQKPVPLVFHLDPATTEIHWTLNTTIHTVHGTFKLQSGAVKVDPASGDASGLIVIDASSGESAEASRDKRMHAAVLESAKYPTITFRPAHVDGKVDLAAGGPVTVSGVFTLHGQDHPLRLTITLRPKSSSTQPPAVALTTHFTIPFVAWGLKDPSTFVFRTDKDVVLDIDSIAAPDLAH